MRIPLLLSVLALVGLSTGCDVLFADREPPPTSDSGTEPEADAGTEPPPNGSTVAIANWNLEYFGSTTMGPGDETLQQQNVADVLNGLGAGIIAVEEVAEPSAFDLLQSRMSGYQGVLSSDSNVSNSYEYSSQYDLKLGVLYRNDLMTMAGAQVILGASSSVFAGRPPLEVHFRLGYPTSPVDLYVIVVHLKAEYSCTGTECWQQRKDAADALKQYLDSSRPTANVIVLGDWNDDIDTSIVTGQPTPFAQFVADSADYSYVTSTLTVGGVGTTVGRNTPIDHQLVSNELKTRYVAGSTQVVTPGIFDYKNTTSDHYPVKSGFVLLP